MTAVELVRRPVPTTAPESTFHLVEAAAELAERIHRTEFVPAGLRGKPDAVLACFLYGAEIGVGPMEALAYIAMVDGRPTIAAQLMRARVLGAGHELWEDEASTNTRVTMWGRRAGSTREHSVTWTLDDAKRANLAGRANWRTYPRQMLEARATAQLCRLVFPDVLGASRYATEEVEGGEDAPPEGIGPEIGAQAPPKAKRRRTPAPIIATVEADGSDEAVAPPDVVLPPRPPLPGEPLDVTAEVEVAPGWTTMSEPQRRALFAALREAGITSREDRLAYCGEILQRPISSSAELTPGDASAVIEAARELARQMHPDGFGGDIPHPAD